MNGVVFSDTAPFAFLACRIARGALLLEAGQGAAPSCVRPLSTFALRV